MDNSHIVHQPVLLRALLAQVDYPSNGIVVDTTIGQAGHARPLCEKLDPNGTLVGLDVDPDSLAVANSKLKGITCNINLVRDNFGRLNRILEELGIDAVDLILADLGFSSAQIENADRGFSFQVDGPLDMRLDDRLETTAADLVNTLRENELADLIYQYGEERRSRRIAKAVVWARRNQPIKRTNELVAIVNRAIGFKGGSQKSKIHPATRMFQALRIAVNGELDQLQQLLDQAPGRLKPGGQIAVISFHSLEDRIVKQNFRAEKDKEIYEIMTKKPIVADGFERRENPRSRSAKLRIARRCPLKRFEQGK